MRGCPELETLEICQGSNISDLGPLASCSRLKMLALIRSLTDDLSPLSSMPLLEELSIFRCSSIQSLDPLSGLMNLHYLDCFGIDPQTSLLPLASCTGLKDLRCNIKAMDLRELKKMRPEFFTRIFKL